MPDYQQAKIYSIICGITAEEYVGSTTKKYLAQRLANHVNKFKQWKKGKSNFVTSYKIIERGNYKIELIENFPCETKDELNAREGFFIRGRTCVNRCIAGRTQKIYNIDHAKEISEYQKEYQKEHAKEIKKQKNAKTNCLCGGRYTHSHKAQHFKTKIHCEFIKSTV